MQRMGAHIVISSPMSVCFLPCPLAYLENL